MVSNAFDSSNYPTAEPDQLVVGDRWAWKRSDLADVYDPASYTLHYDFSLQTASGATIALTSAVTDFVVEVSSATTANYKPGEYAWHAYIVRNSDSERVKVDQGRATLVRNLEGNTSDTRSDNYKALEAIKAVLAGTATREQSSYTIAGRAITLRPVSELIDLKNYYQNEVNKELAIERRKTGKSKTGLIRVFMPS